MIFAACSGRVLSLCEKHRSRSCNAYPVHSSRAEMENGPGFVGFPQYMDELSIIGLAACHSVWTLVGSNTLDSCLTTVPTLVDMERG